MFDQQILALVARLNGSGVHTALITSLEPAWRPVIKQADGVAAFEQLFFDGELPGHKPDAALFMAAADRLGVTPGEFVMVDDRPVDPGPLEACGLRYVVYERYDRLTQDLARMGLNLMGS